MFLASSRRVLTASSASRARSLRIQSCVSAYRVWPLGSTDLLLAALFSSTVIGGIDANTMLMFRGIVFCTEVAVCLSFVSVFSFFTVSGVTELEAGADEEVISDSRGGTFSAT